MKNNLKTLTTSLLCAAMACSCSGGLSHHHTEAKEPVPVRVMKAGTAENEGIRTYVGTAVPSKTAVLSCSYPGTVVCLPVKKGEKVRKGDTIAVISSPSVSSTWEMAHATLKQAEDGYNRVVQVHSTGGIPDVKLVEIETQLSKARAAAEAADNALENCTVKAPFNGVAGEIFIEHGIEAGVMEPIARILDISSVEIEFSVPEKEINGINEGEELTVEVPALGNLTFSARIKNKGVSASPLSHSYTCTLAHSPQAKGLMPGMVCKISRSELSGKGTVIPASCVKTDASGRYVWTVNESTVYKKYITVGGFSGTGVIITDGLSEGDNIITEGSQKVSGGMKVKVL